MQENGRRQQIDTVVIGGGQAGLCMSYVLRTQGREHVVLEKKRALEQWRSARWDSFRINSPLGYSRLMGQEDGLPDSLMNMPLRETLRLWDDCIARRAFPIREHAEVVSIERADDGRFHVRVKGEGGPELYDANNVVAAPGQYQLPRLPAFASRLSESIQQLRVGTYTNPSAVQAGAVLVVGGGQTGVQISEELARAGRRVYLATSKVMGTPRTYRGEDIMFWEERTGLLATPKEEITDPGEKYVRQPIVGHNHPISHDSLARLGMVLLGGLEDISADGTTAIFKDDLRDNIAYARASYDQMIKVIEDWITANGKGSEYPPPSPELEWQPHPALMEASPPRRLNLEECGIRAVVWATGWRADLSWLRIDAVRQALGPQGLPESCDSPVEGFFWLGFDWLRTRTSGNGVGFHLDAPYVASRLR